MEKIGLNLKEDSQYLGINEKLMHIGDVKDVYKSLKNKEQLEYNGIIMLFMI